MPRKAKRCVCGGGNVPSMNNRSERSFSLMILGGMVSDRHSRDLPERAVERQAPEAKLSSVDEGVSRRSRAHMQKPCQVL